MIYTISINKRIPNMMVSLPVGNGKNVHLRLDLAYNLRGGYWTITIADAISGEEYVSNAPMLTYGDRNASYSILKQFRHFGIGNAYIMPVSDNIKADYPHYKGFDADFELVWVMDDE